MENEKKEKGTPPAPPRNRLIKLRIGEECVTAKFHPPINEELWSTRVCLVGRRCRDYRVTYVSRHVCKYSRSDIQWRTALKFSNRLTPSTSNEF